MRLGALHALLVGAALAAPVPLAAQEAGEGAAGGIVAEELPSLTPPGEGATGEATIGEAGQGEPGRPLFKRAPFRTEAPPVYHERIELPETELRAGAKLRRLDKIAGRSEVFTLAAGKEVTEGWLRVRLEACRSPADNAPQGTIAFLKAYDTRDEEGKPVFSGWMFAESPAISAMDHPRYDLWVISCITSEAGASASSE